MARKLSHPVLGRSQRSSGGSLLGPNIAPDFRRRASPRWLRCNRTALRPCQERVVGGALDALPAKAGSASAAAHQAQSQHRRHFSFHVEHFVSPFTSSSRNATPRCCVHFVCLSTRRSCETAIYSRHERILHWPVRPLRSAIRHQGWGCSGYLGLALL